MKKRFVIMMVSLTALFIAGVVVNPSYAARQPIPATGPRYVRKNNQTAGRPSNVLFKRKMGRMMNYR